MWLRIEPNLFAFRPKKLTGRKLANRRKTLNAIIFRMRSGCQCDQLPGRCGPKSTVHDWFQRWAKAGIVERIWAIQAAVCDELGGVQWEWQSADPMLGKARFAGGKGRQDPNRPQGKRDQEIGVVGLVPRIGGQAVLLGCQWVDDPRVKCILYKHVFKCEMIDARPLDGHELISKAVTLDGAADLRDH